MIDRRLNLPEDRYEVIESGNYLAVSAEQLDFKIDFEAKVIKVHNFAETEGGHRYRLIMFDNGASILLPRR